MLGAGSLAVRADVSNLTDLDTMFATIKREFGHLDGVFVNAGYSEFLLFEEGDRAKLRQGDSRQFQRGLLHDSKSLALLRQGSSVIINASVGARKGWPTTSAVSTCKAAVVHLARIISAELVDRGIRANTLSPGPTDTAMFGRYPGGEQGEAVKDVLRINNPSKRIADPLEIAKLAVYLASDDSAYVVGADFLIDGGGHSHFGRGRLSLVAESRGRSCSRSGRGRLAHVIMNKPDEKEIGNEGTQGSHRPRRQGSGCYCARRASRWDAHPWP